MGTFLEFDCCLIVPFWRVLILKICILCRNWIIFIWGRNYVLKNVKIAAVILFHPVTLAFESFSFSNMSDCCLMGWHNFGLSPTKFLSDYFIYEKDSFQFYCFPKLLILHLVAINAQSHIDIYCDRNLEVIWQSFLIATIFLFFSFIFIFFGSPPLGFDFLIPVVVDYLIIFPVYIFSFFCFFHLIFSFDLLIFFDFLIPFQT